MLLFIFSAFEFASSSKSKVDTSATTLKKPLRAYTTTRLTTAKPDIDGILNDECWKTGEWAGDFTQWVPKEGAKPSQPTQIKILYDDKNIYVAIRAFDSEPKKISKKAGKRDELTGDMVGINFDSYHDRRTGFEFDVTAAGQKIDILLTNPSNVDFSWNAVWYAKTGLEDSAWTAEFEIPLSQLRYSSDYEQVWGMHVWRWIERFQEESDWEVQSSKGPGILYLFGELHGIKGLPKSQRIEIMPYTLGKLNTFKKEPDNPYTNKGRKWAGDAGLDAKIGLSSNFTADLTVNPDFGQVEADPSVMNLTAFETFFDEKRPFFLEGKNIFSYDFDNVNLFYSRRIGHAPTYKPDLKDNEYMDFPDNTAILGAAKISGKNANGLSIGVLQSATSDEQAKISYIGKNRNVNVEPLTSYNVTRIQQDLWQGNTILGGIFTSTNRFINDSNLYSLNKAAYTGGLDLLHQWHDKEFYVEGKIVGSDIQGNSKAIKDLQYASARYYQRPDVNYFHFDSTRTQLSGYGGRIKIGKGSKGLWRYSAVLNFRSPGLDLNDIGFMPMADVINETNNISYFINQPISVFRTYNAGLSQTNNWDFGKRFLSSQEYINAYFEFKNQWAIQPDFKYISQALDTRILRGGPAMYVPPVIASNIYMRTDYTKKLFVELESYIQSSENQLYYIIQPGFFIMPLNTLKFSGYIGYTKNVDNLQYVDTKQSASNINQYILGKIDQQTISFTLRIDYNISPEISLQYYGSPFASVGKYENFKSITDPLAANYYDRFETLKPVLNGDNYEIFKNNSTSKDYSFKNPNFSFVQFRSNLVFRWEYRPGSQFYFVWSDDMTNYENPAHYQVNNALGRIKGIFPNNVFLIKFNYWFSI